MHSTIITKTIAEIPILNENLLPEAFKRLQGERKVFDSAV
jgi:hypothetical protein